LEPVAVDVRPSALGVAGPLEHEGEPVLILRHHCRPPSTSASLIQEIRERVLIVARVP
jgi:hypothetical protein